MGTGYESKIWICGKPYEAHTGGLDRTSAQRTVEMLKEQGFLVRKRSYHPNDPTEKQYVVYYARPRRIASYYPLGEPMPVE